MELYKKKEKLEEVLRSYGSAAVAFSSGVDSTFLLKVARDVLGDAVMAVTVRSAFCPAREADEAAAFCAREGIRHRILEADVLGVPGVAANPPDRCYLCKRALFTLISRAAGEAGMAVTAEGSNMDDLGDYRPGLRAVEELGIRSPLREAGLYKEEIRQLSREMGLPTWDKPAFACLASRFVYGQRLSEEGLAMVDAAEQYLMALGLRQVRVRVHGPLARIEAESAAFETLLSHAGEINDHLRSLGFLYVTVDLGGYRMGSMNNTLEL